MNQQPDDSTPTEERQAELTAACERNLYGPGTFQQLAFAIRTRGELQWLLHEQGWSGEIVNHATCVLIHGSDRPVLSVLSLKCLIGAMLDRPSFLWHSMHLRTVRGAGWY